MKLTLKAAFLLPVLFLVATGLAVLVWIGATATKDAATAMLRSDLPIIAQAIVEDVSGSMVLKTQTLRTWTDIAVVRDTAVGKAGQEAFQKRMSATVAAIGELGVDYVSLYSLTGELVGSSLPGPLAQSNMADRDYFKAVVSGGQTAFLSKAIFSRISQKPVLVVAAPVKGEDGRIVGALTAAVDLNALTGAVSATKIGSTGRVQVYEPDGTAIAHDDPGQLMKTGAAKAPLIASALAVSGDALLTGPDGRLGAVRKDPFTKWTFVVLAPMEDLAAQTRRAVDRQTLLAAVFTVLLAAAIWIVSAKVVAGPLGRCQVFAKAVAAGDLDRAITPETSCVEMRELSGALAGMVGTLKTNIEHIRDKQAHADELAQRAQDALRQAEEAQSAAARSRQEGLAEAAGRLDAVVQGVNGSSEDLARQMDDAVRFTNIQQDRTAQTATAMEQMNATILEVSRSAQGAASQTNLASKQARGGRALVEEALKAISGVDALAADLKTAMDALAGQTKAVDQVLTTISDIADQTNLLALNAAIEAARAGEQGRGFAVVADEVRKLAEKTMAATKDVGHTIGAIQDGTQGNAARVQRMAEAASQATQLAQNSGASLGEIVSLVETASDQVRGIAAASEEQSAASEQINRSVEEIRELASNIANGMAQAGNTLRGLARQNDTLERVIGHLRCGQLEVDCTDAEIAKYALKQ